MDLGPSESQQLLKRNAREFLDKNSTPAMVRQMEEDRTGFDPSVWKQVCDLGWAGLLVPEEYGGSGGDVIDMTTLFEEVGRHAFMSPLFTSGVLSALTILAVGSEDQKKALLPQISSGEKVFTLALNETTNTYEPWGVQAKASQKGSGYSITGTKLYVYYANVADTIIVAARTNDGAGADGIGFYLVDPKSAGVKVTILDTIDKGHQYIVEMNDAEATALGSSDGAWDKFQWAFERAAVISSGDAVGAAERCLELAVDYSKQRVQFGRPIGSFQALQHKMAKMITWQVGAQLAVFEAAYKLSNEEDSGLEVAIAKASASEAYSFCSIECTHVHGGASFIRGSEAELFFRRGKTSEVLLGHPRWHRKRITALMAAAPAPAAH